MYTPPINIFAQIRLEADTFYNGNVSVVPGYSFNQYETIKRIHLYLNSKYQDDSQFLGREKLFFNIVTAPCEVATKMLNVDTKNIRLWPQNPKSHLSTHLLEKELKTWLKSHRLGRVLNEMAYEAPRFGTVLLEKTKDGAEMVDLRKLIIDPTVENVQKSRFVTTIHYMTPTELRATGWDKREVEYAIENFSGVNAPTSFEDRDGEINYVESTPYVKVYKRYGEVPRWWIDGGKSDELVKAIFIVAGADSFMTDDKGNVSMENGCVLFKSRWYKKWPYKDFHYGRVKGRWLGLGIVEMLFDVQQRVNELKNQKRISMEISTIHLFQSKDRQIVRNILTDLRSGDVLTSPNGIEPVVNEERNLPAFKDEEASFMQQADRLSFAYEAVRGESMPSSTPATNALLANQQAASVFAFKRENLGLFLQDFFNELVLPQLLKDLTPEHIMRYTGTVDELERLDEAASDLYAHDYVKKRLLDGLTTTPEQSAKEKEEAKLRYKKLGDARYLKIKDALYDDVEFEFDFIITNEQADPATIVQNTQAVFSALAANPMMLQDPAVKLLFYRYAESLGVSPAELEMADSMRSKQVAQAATGVPVATMQGQAQAAQVQRPQAPQQPQLTA